MQTQATFDLTARRLMKEQENAALRAQLAMMLDMVGGEGVSHVWLRESDDLINLVGLGQKCIFDVSWLPASSLTQSVVLPIDQILSLEVREGEDAALAMGLSVTGDLAIVVHTSADRGGVVWAAKDEPSVSGLRSFVTEVAKALKPFH